MVVVGAKKAVNEPKATAEVDEKDTAPKAGKAKKSARGKKAE